MIDQGPYYALGQLIGVAILFGFALGALWLVVKVIKVAWHD